MNALNYLLFFLQHLNETWCIFPPFLGENSFVWEMVYKFNEIVCMCVVDLDITKFNECVYHFRLFDTKPCIRLLFSVLYIKLYLNVSILIKKKLYFDQGKVIHLFYSKKYENFLSKFLQLCFVIVALILLLSFFWNFGVISISSEIVVFFLPHCRLDVYSFVCDLTNL